MQSTVLLDFSRLISLSSFVRSLSPVICVQTSLNHSAIFLHFPLLFRSARCLTNKNTKHKSDLDIDDNVSHVEGSTTVMSAGESESESENEPNELETEVTETPYIHTPEDEFGAVSCVNFVMEAKSSISNFT
jgi:hypothetical protein